MTRTDASARDPNPEYAPTPAGAPPACARKPLSPLACAWLAALLAWTSIVAFYRLDAGPGLEPSAAWVAQPAREMYQNISRMLAERPEKGWNWRPFVVPTLCNETRLQKSPGAYWAVCLTASLRGGRIDELSARIPNAVAAVLLVLTIFWLTRRIAGERAAIFAGFAAAASAMLLDWSHEATSDLGVATLIAMSLACLWVASEDEPPGARRTLLWLAGYLLAGLAMLYKMPLPVVCIGLPAMLYVLLLRRWRIFASRWHLLGLLLFLLPWVPWVLAVIHYEPMALAKWRVEYIDRVTGDLPNYKDEQRRWAFYLLYVGAAFALAVPWSLSIPGAIARAFRRKTEGNRSGFAFLLIWFFSLLVFLTVAAGKETRYFLPAMPPLLMLLGCELAAFFDSNRRPNPLARKVGLLAVVLLVPGGLAALTLLLRRYWVGHLAKGLYTWPEVWHPYAVAAAIFSAGAILAAWLYHRRRAEAAFAALVGGTWLTWLWAWPCLMPILGTQRPMRDFAAQLRTLDPGQRAALRQIGHQDPRYIWYSDVRFPRVIDQLELLKEEHGRRNLAWEMQRVGEEIIRYLRGDTLALFVASPKHYILFQSRARAEIESRGEEFPHTWIWLIGRLGREDQRYIVFGNQPPPWPEPRLPELLRHALNKRLAAERKRLGVSPATAPSATGYKPVPQSWRPSATGYKPVPQLPIEWPPSATGCKPVPQLPVAWAPLTAGYEPRPRMSAVSSRSHVCPHGVLRIG